jgi:hypothetical protein
LKFFKFQFCHNLRGCRLCNFARSKITTLLQPPKGVLELMLTNKTHQYFIIQNKLQVNKSIFKLSFTKIFSKK